jgi:hypothetical protein
VKPFDINGTHGIMRVIEYSSYEALNHQLQKTRDCLDEAKITLEIIASSLPSLHEDNVYRSKQFLQMSTVTTDGSNEINVFQKAPLYSHDECQAKLEALQKKLDIAVSALEFLNKNRTHDTRVTSYTYEILKKIKE